MSAAPLSAALRNKAATVRCVHVTTEKDAETLRDAADLLRVLANIVEGAPAVRSFGPPGDWGYDTELGRALVIWRAASAPVAVPVDPPLRDDPPKADGATVHAMARRLLDLAASAGQVVTIEQSPLLPLAMGHYLPVITVRAKR